MSFYNQPPHVVTCDTVYIRFHDTTGHYSGSYPQTQLKEWLAWLEEQAKKARKIYVYFNNDAQVHAINNAKKLKDLLNLVKHHKVNIPDCCC